MYKKMFFVLLSLLFLSCSKNYFNSDMVLFQSIDTEKVSKGEFAFAPDKSFIYSETPVSSYLHSGIWHEDSGTIYIEFKDNRLAGTKFNFDLHERKFEFVWKEIQIYRIQITSFNSVLYTTLLRHPGFGPNGANG